MSNNFKSIEEISNHIQKKEYNWSINDFNKTAIHFLKNNINLSNQFFKNIKDLNEDFIIQLIENGLPILKYIDKKFYTCKVLQAHIKHINFPLMDIPPKFITIDIIEWLFTVEARDISKRYNLSNIPENILNEHIVKRAIENDVFNFRYVQKRFYKKELLSYVFKLAPTLCLEVKTDTLERYFSTDEIIDLYYYSIKVKYETIKIIPKKYKTDILYLKLIDFQDLAYYTRDIPKDIQEAVASAFIDYDAKNFQLILKGDIEGTIINKQLIERALFQDYFCLYDILKNKHHQDILTDEYLIELYNNGYISEQIETKFFKFLMAKEAYKLLDI